MVTRLVCHAARMRVVLHVDGRRCFGSSAAVLGVVRDHVVVIGLLVTGDLASPNRLVCADTKHDPVGHENMAAFEPLPSASWALNRISCCSGHQVKMGRTVFSCAL